MALAAAGKADRAAALRRMGEMGSTLEGLPYVCEHAGWMWEAAADKDKDVKSSAEAALRMMADSVLTFCCRSYLAGLRNGLCSKAKPQQKELALDILGTLAEKHPLAIGQELDWSIPMVGDLMTDVKPTVAQRAADTMRQLLDTCGNRDLTEKFPAILKANGKLKDVPESVEELARTVFVQKVEAPALAALIPVFVRGLSQKSDQDVRRTCVIIDNMCKLVEDPREGYPLLGKVYGLVQRNAESVSDPEARGIVEKTLATMKKVIEAGGRPDLKATDTLSKLAGPHIRDGQTLKLLSEASEVLAFTNTTDTQSWNDVLMPFLGDEALVKNIASELAQSAAPPQEVEFKDDDGEDLYKGSFSLAYGTLTLLRESSLLLKKNRVYALLGANGCGKSTLMREIAREKVEGFPKQDELRSVFIEHDIHEREIEPPSEEWPLGKKNIDLCGTDWVVDQCNNVFNCRPAVTREQASDKLVELGFADSQRQRNPQAKADSERQITSYSGGWKMKMQLAAGALVDADILMLDEPTGHMDTKNKEWMRQWLHNFKGTIIVSSIDEKFLNELITRVIWFDNLKLKQFKGQVQGQVLTEWVTANPAFKSFFELKSDTLSFNFPTPGALEGVKSRSKDILRMTNVSFRYPGKKDFTVQDISLSMSMLSRVAVVGPNGAGKSTAIKLLLGELKPEIGTIMRVSGSRIAYVAQHAFHHLDNHLTKTPAAYIMWRFAGNEDRESDEFANREANADEEKLQKVPWCIDAVNLHVRRCVPGEKKDIPVVPEAILQRRKNKEKKYEYEVKWFGKPVDMATWVVRDTMLEMGFAKMVNREDEKKAAEAGLMTRPLTQQGVESHLSHFGLSAEHASHTPIEQLAAGQKVKVALGAAMWLNPHIVVLDEPTNYLDREGLGALTVALKNYGGGVVIITHNEAFANGVATEQWIMDAGRLRREGEVVGEDVSLTDAAQADEVMDGAGNKIEVKKNKELPAKEMKKLIKDIEKQLKDGKKKKLPEEEMWLLEDRLAELKTQLEGLAGK